MNLNAKLWLFAGAFIALVGLLLAFLTELQLFAINRSAAFSGFRVHRSIPYGDSPEQLLDVYQPKKNTQELLPVLVFFYGGCWGACSTLKKEQYAFVAEGFSSNKMIAVVADYRLYPSVNFPTIMADASRVLEWVHAQIEAYGGDPQRVFLMGHSSGAHIAAMLAVNPQYLTPSTYDAIRGFIGLAGPYNFLPFDEDYMPILFGPPMQPADSQPIHFVDGTQPPSLLLYGLADTRVKLVNIKGMIDKIQSTGGVVEHYFYDDVGHTQILGAYSLLFRDSKPMFAHTLNFIRKYDAANSMRKGANAQVSQAESKMKVLNTRAND